MSGRSGSFRFRPRLGPSVAMLMLLPLLIGLGVWQLDRAAQKRQILADVKRAAGATPLNLATPLPPFDRIHLHRVVVRGRYDGSHQYLLDNQVRNGRAGYRIMTPLRLAGSTVAVLVNRGWRPASPDRDRLPAIPAPSGVRRVEGLLTRGPSVGLRLGETYVGDGTWPRRIQYLDFQALDGMLDYSLAPMVVEPDVSVSERAGEAEGGIGPERHIGYAVQWFALAVALLVIYVVVNIRRVESVNDE